MTANSRHTNAEIRAGIEWLESEGWTMNDDGTITRTRLRTKRLRHDPRAKNAEPRYFVVLDRGQATITRSDLVAAKFGLVAARKRPDEAKVGLRLNLEP